MTRTPLATHSRFAQRIHRRYEAELRLLPLGLPGADQFHTVAKALRAQGHSLANTLRITRQLVVERLLQLDTHQLAGLPEVTRAMTDLAEFALNQALQEAHATLQASHGVPMTPQGQAAQVLIIGMGKLGARELNVSSDIDLIYIYDEDGDTTGTELGRGRITNHEYFAKLVRVVYALLGDTTEHGFVFRVDLALRPNGNSGPAAVSIDALEEYLHVQGREWERFAWLKSRVVAPVSSTRTGAAQALRKVVLPFVFRRYLDYSVFDALRDLHRQIREHAARRSAGHPERANDVKLSRGGIREIEFTVQLLQVVRGGQFPELRTRPTLNALQRLVRANLMSAQSADALAQAYTFLRQLEHRIQYLDDQQTHLLPTCDSDLNWIALSMGLASSQQLLTQLDRHREWVAQEFDKLLGGPQAGCTSCQGKHHTLFNLDEWLPRLGPALGLRLEAWREHPRILALRDEARSRLMRLLARTVQWVDAGRATEEAALRLVDWIEPLLRRESYLALLLERPNVHESLLRLLGAARWPARYLLLHPGVIDELAGSDIFFERFNADEFEADLEHRRQALKNSGEDDDEALLNLLRRMHHAEVFRTLARDVEGKLTVEQVADDLSALADAVLRVTSRWCWSRLKQAHRPDPQFGIIAYGKLGGKELGYGSDLDLVFIYDDADERAGEVYGALVRKLINWLTVKTGEGDLYEIDTALRPNGNAGLLVTSFDSYSAYQLQRGSNTAWTWEHQAMTRARCVLGNTPLRQGFDAVRLSVITARRDPASLRNEIMAMRERMAHAFGDKPGLFDIKQSPGGMIDAEFVMQYLVLCESGQHPELVANTGNIALLERAEVLGLLPAHIGHAAATAYRHLRQIQHTARLNEETTQVDALTLVTERRAILALWRAVFQSSPDLHPTPAPSQAA